MSLFKGKANRATADTAATPQGKSLALAYNTRRQSKAAKGKAHANDKDMELTPSAATKVTLHDELPKERALKPGDDDDHADQASAHNKNMTYSSTPVTEGSFWETHDELPRERGGKPGDSNSSMHATASNHEMSRQSRPPFNQDQKPRDSKNNNPNDQGDMVDQIIRKKFADGGLVDKENDGSANLQEQEMEHSNQYYDRNEDALNDHMGNDLSDIHNENDSTHGIDEDYSSPDDMDSGNMDSEDIQHDVVDHIDQIMNRMNRKNKKR